MIATSTTANVAAHENPYRNQLLQAQISGCFDTHDWRSLVAVTFSVKQGIREHGYMFYGGQEIYTKAFNRFMRRLNRAVHGNAARRFDKRLRVLAVVEKSRDGRWHIHAAIEPPDYMSKRSFRRAILRYWSTKNVWAYRENKVELDADAGWIGYCLKPRQKSGLEAWSDSIDWYSFYNPPVDG